MDVHEVHWDGRNQMQKEEISQRYRIWRKYKYVYIFNNMPVSS